MRRLCIRTILERLAALTLAASPWLPLHAAPAVQSVSQVNPQRYAGTWYEVARLPNRFQSQCASDVTATYALLEDGSLQVVNRCRRADQAWEKVEGRAVAAEGDASGARLKVSFLPRWLQWLPLGQGDYWVVLLDDNYRYSVVSEPSREYLWVLSRTPTLDAATFGQINAWLRGNGYPVDRLVATPQSLPAGAFTVTSQTERP